VAVEPGDKLKLYDDTIHTFLQLHRYLRNYARRARAEGISGRKISALRRLLDSGPQTIGQLSDYHYVCDSSASEMVSELEQAGYVTRARSELDNRVVVVELTPAGRDFAENAPLGGIPLLRERLRELPAERLSAIDEALAELVHLLGIDDDD
jgi:DNA-binding MarR family transcriptional regulator